MKTRKATLTEVYAEAMTNKAFLKALKGGPTKMKQELKRRRIRLAPADVATLEALAGAANYDRLPPPPPPWQPDFGVIAVILTALTSRISSLENDLKGAGSRGTRIR